MHGSFPRPRQFEPLLREVASLYPVITLTGPRQSGKTTLCRSVFPDLPYVNLEPLDQRDYARSDPRGLLAEHPEGMILDEIQHAPDLPSYIQEIVDNDPRPGRYVLTGSQHFGLTQAVSQSLAGRTAVLHLLPLVLNEFEAFETPKENLFEVMLTGGYPRIHQQKLDPSRWVADYVATYVERDVRQISNVGDLTTFAQFLRLCAARTAQELNLSALGADAGISHNTAKSWLSILEASFLVLQAPAWRSNVRKQIVKAPKVHFLDSGLVCHLLGIRSADELRHHPLRGPIFESWVVSEIAKHRTNRGLPWDIFHYREARGAEVDLLVKDGLNMIACEVKSGATIQRSFFKNLSILQERLIGHSPPMQSTMRLLYGGESNHQRSGVQCLGWRSIQDVDWA